MIESPKLLYNSPKYFNALGIVSDLCESCAALLIRPLQLVQLRLLLAFRLRARCIAAFPLPLCDFVINLLAFWIPRPVVIVKLKSMNKSIESKKENMFP